MTCLSMGKKKGYHIGTLPFTLAATVVSFAEREWC